MPLYLAFLWHMHQPYYILGGHASLPWVRLHTIVNYLHMAELLRDYPRIHCSQEKSPEEAILDETYPGHLVNVFTLMGGPPRLAEGADPVAALTEQAACDILKLRPVLPALARGRPGRDSRPEGLVLREFCPEGLVALKGLS